MARPARTNPSPPGNAAQQQAVIGPSIVIRGELSGSEDLLIEGRVEGEIQLTDNRVTVGSHGQVEADIRGKAIEIRGRVTGNLYSSEQVIVRSSGTLLGNIVAPRVALEDGATFKGAIDMASASARAEPSTGSAKSSSAAGARQANGRSGSTAGATRGGGGRSSGPNSVSPGADGGGEEATAPTSASSVTAERARGGAESQGREHAR